MTVGSRTRSFIEVVPPKGLGAKMPILMVLHGVGATAGGELIRDGFADLAEDGQAELVYPQGVDDSWNADGCCGKAASLGVDDIGFLEKLASLVDPGGAHPLYLVGYSDGGRMAYTLDCVDPSLFDAVAVVDADPDSGCVLSKPLSIVQLDGTTDPIVPYTTGDKGDESPTATAQSTKLRALDKCPTNPTASTTVGMLQIRSWTRCAGGTRYTFDSFVGVGHRWVEGTTTTPSEGEAIWAFLSATAPRPGLLQGVASMK